MGYLTESHCALTVITTETNTGNMSNDYVVMHSITKIHVSKYIVKGRVLILSKNLTRWQTRCQTRCYISNGLKGMKIDDFGFTHFSVYSCDEITGTHNLTEVNDKIGLINLAEQLAKLG